MTTEACAQLVERADPDRFLATMAAPPAARRVLFPLYAFNLEVSRTPWMTREPMIAAMRLQFWRDTLDGIGAGKPPRPHGVAAALAGAIGPADVPVLDALVAARRWDIYKDPFEDQTHLDRYLNATSGGLYWTAAHALGAPAAAETTVRAYGFAAGLAGFLRAVPALQARGRAPLPDGTPQGIRDLADRGLKALARARAARDTVPSAAAPALFAGWRAATTLNAARTAPERVIEGQLSESEFLRRARLLWVAFTGRW
ncbi:MAG: squalene/phytoene synthase family protein [Rhodobacteraceae bacterium]|nr:squalene/phytoene synthase family protein [Paracoccaceae bacterium]